MDFLEVLFPVSGVRTNILIPPLVALVISFFTSMGGLSGAFLLLPFQMSFLNFTSPSVSATNFLYNIVAIPGGVYRYIKEGRMAWTLTLIVILGTLPGVLIGYYLRIMYFPDPRIFKLFVGLVLLYPGARLIFEAQSRNPSSPFSSGKRGENSPGGAERMNIREERLSLSSRYSGTVGTRGTPSSETVVKHLSCSLKKTEYEFLGKQYSFSTLSMLALSSAVGIIGGIYGIGGGAIIAPFCLAVFHLPVYTIAGATLLGTFITSVVGVAFYSLIPAKGGIQTSPDWLLGLLFGAGGLAGTYLGARFQKFVPQKSIKIILGFLVLLVASQYIMQFF